MSDRIDPEAYAFGQKLQHYRELAKITQYEMAEACGMTKNYISALERGVHKCNAQTFIVYAEKCNCSLDEIAGITGAANINLELKKLLSLLDDEQQKKVLDIVKILIK